MPRIMPVFLMKGRLEKKNRQEMTAVPLKPALQVEDLTRGKAAK